MSPTVRLLLLMWLVVPPAFAQEGAPGAGDQSFKRLSIEQLGRIDVTSVSKHAEPAWEAPAAIVIITGDDIRRAGARTLPDAMRLAVGVAVSQYDGHTWAISARGFNAPAANKMVVMIDGRSVYTPLFSGVFWDVQDVMLSDVDRIEVIRGPGSTLWGANAVNGVINIITKSARDTTGATAVLRAGNRVGQAGFRYGRALGSGLAYRTYARVRSRGAGSFASGAPARDPFRFGQAGFRVDAERGPHTAMTIQGDAYGASSGLFDRAAITMAGGNLLGRVRYTQSSGAQLRLQLYYDGTSRTVPRQYGERRDTLNGEAEYRFAAGARHDVVGGGGFDVARSRTKPSSVIFFDPANRTTTLISAFLADDITLVRRRVHLIIGSKIEHNDYTGVEFQPSIKARWTPDPRQTVWGAVSRAVRMPTRFDVDLRFTGSAPFVVLRGDPDFHSETAVAYEAGYRRRLGTRLSFDAAAFVNRFDRLRTQEPTPPTGFPIVLRNLGAGRISGVEISSRVQPIASWQLQAGYGWLSERFDFSAASRDASLGRFEHQDPRHQGWLQSFVTVADRVEVDVFLRAVGALPSPRVAAYAELNAHLEYRLGPAWQIALVGENLLHARHLELIGQAPPETADRRVFLESRWVF